MPQHLATFRQRTGRAGACAALLLVLGACVARRAQAAEAKPREPAQGISGSSRSRFT
jgi:hypothetical protein